MSSPSDQYVGDVPEPTTFAQVFAALGRSRDRLELVLSSLSPEQIREGSYCDEWSRAQVASHLGSGAEIFGGFVEAGLRAGAPLGTEQLRPVWERWNGKTPEEQVADCLTADRRLLDLLGGIDDLHRSSWRLEMFGAERSLLDVVRMRLSEHALHSWDIVVSIDPGAGLEDDATLVLVDWIGTMVQRAEPVEQMTLAVVTTAPARHFVLELSGGAARLRRDGDASLPYLELPAEAFIRLVSGRLDPGHTPASATAQGVDLDAVRRAFPGY
ncbi:MAG TPA: maleylpyruvate isomerase family mycothiol-dependent enzyme [Acidimicrobiales bacterium]|nr:maleylpyruvate isomerase family mycothiol-dependent enzyme [Acidimicrobiales bacterium]